MHPLSFLLACVVQQFIRVALPSNRRWCWVNRPNSLYSGLHFLVVWQLAYLQPLFCCFFTCCKFDAFTDLCAGFYRGGIPSTMPWRSKVGAPYGRVDFGGEESLTERTPPDAFSVASGSNAEVPEWDDSLAETGQLLVCDGQDAVSLFGAPSEDGFELGGDVPLEEQFYGSEFATLGAPKSVPMEAPRSRAVAGVDDNLFFNMVKLKKPQEPLKQPWEKGVMAQICSRSKPKLPMPWLTLPTLGKRDSLTAATPVEEPPEKQAFRTPFHFRRLLTTRLAQTDDQLRAKALRRLRDLILVSPEQSILGRTLLDVSGQLVGEDRISCVFADAFRSRATATLVKRSMDYYKMAVWLDQQLDLRPMQVSENAIYQYLSFLREVGAAPTLGEATVKAVWFMHSTAGFIDFRPDSFSSRVTGVCRDMFLRKRILKQAPAFPVRIVRALEEYALLTRDAVDSRFVNFLLFCIYSSCRVGDASKITEVTFSQFQEVHLVEASTTEAKNTATMERRRRLLPFTAVGWGVYPNPWSIKWKLQLDAEKHATIMPAVSEVSGLFLDRRLTTAEANVWLKEVLMRIGLTMSDACKYSTHSCKATIPTWAGKWGGFSIDERRMLTHHMDAGSMMPLTYSRDNLTALHARVFRMLTAIRNYEFDPDDSNAARIFKENADLFQIPAEGMEPTDDWAASESDVSGEESLQEASHFMRDHQTHANEVCGDRLIHRESMVVHVLRDQQTMWCGRKKSPNYRVWQIGDPDFEQLLVCHQCDRAKP